MSSIKFGAERSETSAHKIKTPGNNSKDEYNKISLIYIYMLQIIELYIHLHIFINVTWISSTYFRKILKYKISLKSETTYDSFFELDLKEKFCSQNKKFKNQGS
jgi:hypothetical protein